MMKGSDPPFGGKTPPLKVAFVGAALTSNKIFGSSRRASRSLRGSRCETFGGLRGSP